MCSGAGQEGKGHRAEEVLVVKWKENLEGFLLRVVK